MRRLHLTVVLALTIVAVTGLGACGSSGSSSSSAAGSSTAVAGTSTASGAVTSAPATAAPTTSARGSTSTVAPTPGTKDVAVVDYAFSPEALQAKVGDLVVWTNQDDAEHWVITTDKSLDSGGFAKGATYQHPFTTPGTTEYYCNIHNGMKGTIVVT